MTLLLTCARPSSTKAVFIKGLLSPRNCWICLLMTWMRSAAMFSMSSWLFSRHSSSLIFSFMSMCSGLMVLIRNSQSIGTWALIRLVAREVQA